MASEDKLIGVQISGGSTTRVYGAYRIDYDSTDSIGTIAGLGENETVDSHYSGAVKNPPAGYSGHEAKQGYQRKVIVEDATTRDEVVADLDAAGVAHSTPEDISPTATEQQHIEEFGAMNGLEAAEGVKWGQELSNASSVSDLKKIQRGVAPSDGSDLTRPPDDPA